MTEKKPTPDPLKKDTTDTVPVDNRGGTFDPGFNDSTHDIYTNPDNLPEGLQRKGKGPLGPTQGRRGGNKD
jgi:hypothetical protein